MKVLDYRDLRVYRLAFESAMEIFELSRKWSLDERFSLTDHICRQLTKMIDDAPTWCNSTAQVREMPVEYFIEPQSPPSPVSYAPRSTL
jgi:hypothetical protein